MTHAELLQAVYRFYPRNLWPTSAGYQDTREYRRRVEVTRRAGIESPKWKALLLRLGERYQVHDCARPVVKGSVDSAYTAKLGILGKEAEEGTLDGDLGFQVRFSCSVSFLGSYYVVRDRGLAAEASFVEDIAREIVASYGYAPIPPDLGDIIVPDVALDTLNLGEATIYDCLLSAPGGGATSH
jgi:hypothetical protein